MHFKIVIIIFAILLLFPSNIMANDSALISSQLDALNLSSFIKEGENYTKESFSEIDINKLLNSAVSGNINNKNLYKTILILLGKEVALGISTLGKILIIIVIHSVLKNISENIGNNEVSQIAYYVEFILIVTLAMSNFTTIIESIRESITNLISYINILVPILLSLIVTTRKCSKCKYYTAYYFICNNIYR